MGFSQMQTDAQFNATRDNVVQQNSERS